MSFTQKLMKPCELDINTVTFSEPKKFGEAGAKIVYTNVNNSKFAFYTPSMHLPFGLGKYAEPGKSPKYTLDLSFGDMGNNPKNKELFDKIKEFDEKIIDAAQKNALSWFKKKTLSEGMAHELYSSGIKFPKNKETGEVSTQYPPTLNVKIPFYNDTFSCDIFDHAKKEVVDNIEDNIQKGQTAKAIIECSGIWFAGGKYGTTWKLKQLKLGEPINMQKYAFRDDEDDE